jgi:ribosomal-protein-alanine N-acetyltransferase
MRIETQRLYLRPLSAEDCTQTYVDWLNDPQVNRFLETRYARQTLDSVLEFVNAVNGREHEHLFGIFLRAGNLHIGNIKIGPVGLRHPLADISLFLGDRRCWGQGYATEAIMALSRHAFDALGVRKISASMYAPNLGSYHAFLKAGYRQEGVRRRHYLLDGDLCDVFELGLSPEDLE